MLYRNTKSSLLLQVHIPLGENYNFFHVNGVYSDIIFFPHIYKARTIKVADRYAR